MSTDSPASPDLPQSSTPQLVTLDGSTPEVVVPAEKVAAKKPRKPRPPKIVAKLATVAEGVAEQRTGGSASGSETAPTSGADVELRPSKEPELPPEFWAGLMQTQKVIMAKRKSDHYNSFRIV